MPRIVRRVQDGATAASRTFNAIAFRAAAPEAVLSNTHQASGPDGGASPASAASASERRAEKYMRGEPCSRQ